MYLYQKVVAFDLTVWHIQLFNRAFLIAMLIFLLSHDVSTQTACTVFCQFFLQQLASWRL